MVHIYALSQLFTTNIRWYRVCNCKASNAIADSIVTIRLSAWTPSNNLIYNQWRTLSCSYPSTPHLGPPYLASAPGLSAPYFTPTQTPATGTASDPQLNEKPITVPLLTLKTRGVEFQNRIFASPSSTLSNDFKPPWRLPCASSLLLSKSYLFSAGDGPYGRDILLRQLFPIGQCSADNGHITAWYFAHHKDLSNPCLVSCWLGNLKPPSDRDHHSRPWPLNHGSE